MRTSYPQAPRAVRTKFAVEAQFAGGQIFTGSIKHSVQRLDTGWVNRWLGSQQWQEISVFR